jgi:hypothetical protein
LGTDAGHLGGTGRTLKALRQLVGALAVLTWTLVSTHGSRGQEGKTYFYMVDPGPYVLEKLDGRGILQISAGPRKNLLRISFPSNATASEVKRDLKKEFPDLQFVDAVDAPEAR